MDGGCGVLQPMRNGSTMECCTICLELTTWLRTMRYSWQPTQHLPAFHMQQTNTADTKCQKFSQRRSQYYGRPFSEHARKWPVPCDTLPVTMAGRLKRSGSSCSESEKKADKRQVTVNTFQTWQGHHNASFETLSWLRCDKDTTDKTLVALLHCDVCRKYETRIKGQITFLLRGYMGAQISAPAASLTMRRAHSTRLPWRISRPTKPELAMSRWLLSRLLLTVSWIWMPLLEGGQCVNSIFVMLSWIYHNCYCIHSLRILKKQK